MYERAVLRRPTGNVYDADVDLWSLGTTFQTYKFLVYGQSNVHSAHIHCICTLYSYSARQFSYQRRLWYFLNNYTPYCNCMQYKYTRSTTNFYNRHM